MDPGVLEILKVIGIIVLVIVVLCLVAVILFYLALIGFFLAYFIYLFLVKGEMALFNKQSTSSTSLAAVGWLTLVAGAINGIWMAFS